MHCEMGVKQQESKFRNVTPNPDPQEDGGLGDDINAFQERLPIPERPPKSLLDWLVYDN